MARRPSHTPRIVLRFALYAGVAVVFAVALGLWLARWDAVARARADVRSDASFLADRLGRDDLARTAFQWPRSGEAADTTALLDDVLDPRNATQNAVRLTLLSPDGIVTYSSDHRLLGRRVGVPAAAARLTSVDGRRVLEAYVPVYWELAPSHARGFLGVDRDYGPVSAQIRRTFAVQAGTIALALLILYLALLPIMHRLTARLERALAERGLVAALVEHSNDAIVGRDRDGRITSWNAGAEGIYGWREHEIVGRTLDAIVPRGDDPRPELVDELALTRTVHVRKDGKPVRVSVTISPIRDDEGELLGSSLIARDVTALVELEQELQEAQRRDAMARLTAALANDLERALEGRVPEAAAEILDSLRGFGRDVPLRPELVDVNDLVLDVRRRLEQRLDPGVELVVEANADRPFVSADPARLEHVVVDLVHSAEQAMPGTGRVVVATADVDFARRSTARRTDGSAHLQAGHYVMISVSDTAPEPHGDRLGLGLAQVFALVESSGGTIGVETSPGTGTTVRVYLPRAVEAAGERVA